MSNQKYSIIGLGRCGIAMARMFEQYPEYRVYKIGLDPSDEKRYYRLKRQETLERYESDPPKLKTFFRSLGGEILLIVGGSGCTSAASLVILEQIKHCEINVLYVRPDTDLLNDERRLIERTTFNVFQQYARSGVFKCLYLVDNPILETLVGDVPIVRLHEAINESIVPTFHYINVFNNTLPIVDNYTQPIPAARIATFGVVDLETNEEALYYPLKDIHEKQYYYAINEKQLSSDGSLHRNIKEQIKGKRTKQTKVSYGIYATQYQSNHTFLIARTAKIQPDKKHT